MLEPRDGRFGERLGREATPDRQQANHEHVVGGGELPVIAGAGQGGLEPLHLLLDGDYGNGDVRDWMTVNVLKYPSMSLLQQRKDVRVQQEHAYPPDSSS